MTSSCLPASTTAQSPIPAGTPAIPPATAIGASSAPLPYESYCLYNPYAGYPHHQLPPDWTIRPAPPAHYAVLVPSSLIPSNGRAETPPPLQETSYRTRHDKSGQPNVALAPPAAHKLPRPDVGTSIAPPVVSLPLPQYVHNPEIELSSTDTDDSDSIPSQNEGKTSRIHRSTAHTSHPHFRAFFPSFQTISTRGICPPIWPMKLSPLRNYSAVADAMAPTVVS